MPGILNNKGIPSRCGMLSSRGMQSSGGIIGPTGGMLLEWAMRNGVLTAINGPGGTFSRAGAATRVNRTGVLETLAADVVRHDYDFATLSPLGVLTESAKTNVLPGTETLSTGWSLAQSGSSIGATANAAVAPNGLPIAKRVDIGAITAANQYAVIYQNLPVANGDYTLSVWMKGVAGGEVIYLFNPNGGASTQKICVLTTQWQRFSVKVTVANGDIAYNLGRDTRTGSPQPTNLPPASFYVYGAQAELGGLSSYIATNATPLGRAADSWTFPVSAPPAGTLIIHARPYSGGSTTTRRAATGWSDAGNNRLALRLSDGVANNYPNAAVGDGTSISTLTPAAAPIVDGNLEKLALTWDINGSQMARNGVVSSVGGGYAGGAGSLLTVGPGDMEIVKIEIKSARSSAVTLEAITTLTAEEDAQNYRSLLAASGKLLADTDYNSLVSFASQLYATTGRQDFLTLRSAQNMGTGSTAYTFHGKAVTLINGPAWGSEGLVVNSEAQRASAALSLVNATNYTQIAVIKDTGNTRNYPTHMGSGSAAVSVGSSFSGLDNIMIAADGTFINGANVWGTGVRAMITGTARGTVGEIYYNTALSMAATPITATPANFSTFWFMSRENQPYGRNAAIHSFFGIWPVGITAVQVTNIYSVYKSTIGSGLSLP